MSLDCTTSLYAAALEDPEAFGLPADFGDVDPFDLAGDDEEEDDAPRREQHNDHVVVWRRHKAREDHLASLQRGVDMFASELDGSPGCAMWGYSSDFLHQRHTWAEEGEPPSPLRGYPSCALPWMFAPKDHDPSRRHDLVRWRLYRAHAVATAQIVAAGGVDNDHGTLIDRRSFDPWQGLAAWRRMIFTPPSERAAAAKAAKRAKKTADQREQRRKRAPKRASRQSTVAAPTRTIVMTDDGKAIVPLTKGYWAIINAADVPLVEGRPWHVAALPGRKPFAKRVETLANGKTRGVRMHNIAGLSGPVEILPPMTDPRVSEFAPAITR